MGLALRSGYRCGRKKHLMVRHTRTTPQPSTQVSGNYWKHNRHIQKSPFVPISIYGTRRLCPYAICIIADKRRQSIHTPSLRPSSSYSSVLTDISGKGDRESCYIIYDTFLYCSMVSFSLITLCSKLVKRSKIEEPIPLLGILLPVSRICLMCLRTKLIT